MKSSFKRWFLRVVVILFIGLAIFTWWPRDRVGSIELPDLDSRLIADLDGWTWEDRPLADTPELLEVIDEQLTFDTAIYRIYQRDDLAVAVYVAYWLPGKKDFRSVMVHVPDICWPASGWSVQSRNDRFVLDTPRGSLQEGQLRTMARNDGEVDVIFWMLVNGKPLKYTTGNSISEVFRDIASINLIPTEGFYFLRISSNVRMESLKDDRDFQRIVANVADFGLWKK